MRLVALHLAHVPCICLHGLALGPPVRCLLIEPTLLLPLQLPLELAARIIRNVLMRARLQPRHMRRRLEHSLRGRADESGVCIWTGGVGDTRRKLTSEGLCFSLFLSCLVLSHHRIGVGSVGRRCDKNGGGGWRVACHLRGRECVWEGFTRGVCGKGEQ